MKYLLAVVVLATVALGEKLRFDNYTLYRITPKSEKVVEALRLLEEHAYLSGYNFFT